MYVTRHPLTLRLLVLVVMLLIAVALTPAGAACGWYQTCETEAWLNETLAPWLP